MAKHWTPDSPRRVCIPLTSRTWPVLHQTGLHRAQDLDDVYARPRPGFRSFELLMRERVGSHSDDVKSQTYVVSSDSWQDTRTKHTVLRRPSHTQSHRKRRLATSDRTRTPRSARRRRSRSTPPNRKRTERDPSGGRRLHVVQHDRDRGHELSLILLHPTRHLVCRSRQCARPCDVVLQTQACAFVQTRSSK